MMPQGVAQSSSDAPRPHVPLRQATGRRQALGPERLGAPPARRPRRRRRPGHGNAGPQQAAILVDRVAAAQVIQHLAPIVSREAVGHHPAPIQQQRDRAVRRAVSRPRDQGAAAAAQQIVAERAHDLAQIRPAAHISPRALKLTAR